MSTVCPDTEKSLICWQYEMLQSIVNQGLSPAAMGVDSPAGHRRGRGIGKRRRPPRSQRKAAELGRDLCKTNEMLLGESDAIRLMKKELEANVCVNNENRENVQYRSADLLDPEEVLGAHAELHFALEKSEGALKRALVRFPIWLEKQQVNLPKTRVGMNAMIRFLEEFVPEQKMVHNFIHRPIWKRVLITLLIELLIGYFCAWYTTLLVTVFFWLVNHTGLFVHSVAIMESGTLAVMPLRRLPDYCSGFLGEARGKMRNALSRMRKKLRNYIEIPPWLGFAKCHEHSYLVGYTITPEYIWCSRSCVHNDLKALCTRQLLEPVSSVYTRSVTWRHNFESFKRLFPTPVFNFSPEESDLLQEFLVRYPEARRRMVYMAIEGLEGKYGSVSAKTKAFPKVEWLVDNVKKDSRCISGKTDEYLGLTGPTYYKFQKQLVRDHWNSVDSCLREKFIYPGALTSDQIGRIVTHYETLGWHFYEGDFSRYDGHTEEEALSAEFEWYPFPKSYSEYLRMQLKTTGVTRNGIRFGHAGKRASGVINTTLGNTICGMMLFAGYFARWGIVDYVVIQLGDDNIVMTKELIKLDALIAHSTDSGHKLEIKHVEDVDFLEFCSQRFWDVGEFRVLGPKPGRVLSKTFISTDPMMRADQLNDYVLQIAKGFQYYQFVPVLGYFCEQIMAKVHPYKKYKNKFHSYEPIMLREEMVVDQVLIAQQFLKIYGFSPESLHEELDSFNFQPGVALESSLLYRLAAIDGALK